MADLIPISAVTDVGAVAQSLAQLFKMVDDIVMVLNSPQMIAARQRADVQAILARMDDDLKTSQKTGDLSVIDKESSG